MSCTDLTPHQSRTQGSDRDLDTVMKYFVYLIEGAIEAEAKSDRPWDGKLTRIYDREGFSIRNNLDKELLRVRALATIAFQPISTLGFHPGARLPFHQLQTFFPGEVPHVLISATVALTHSRARG